MPPDEDFRLRKLLRKVNVSANPESSAPAYERPTWASAVVQTYCETPSSGCFTHDAKSEVYVSYGFQQPKRFDTADVFQCAANDNWTPSGLLAQDFTKAISERHVVILIGGGFAESKDFHETPIGRIPGVLMNAYAIQAELSGVTISAVPRPLTLPLDVLVGLGVARMSRKTKSLGAVILTAAGSIIAAIVTSAFLFWSGFFWVSFIGVAAVVPLCLPFERTAPSRPEVPASNTVESESAAESPSFFRPQEATPTKEFFISYTHSDEAWAEWIAWQLEEHGHAVDIQLWDFQPGTNFVAEMDRAVSQCERTIIVLSENRSEERRVGKECRSRWSPYH